jgi:acetyl-CoA C-acetyltransferase
MGSAGECIADKYGLTREAMDQYALASHRKAVAAMDAGKFRDELVPVVVPGHERVGESPAVVQDEAPRRDTSLEALRELRPAFRPAGRITAGNAAGLNDAAAALVVASRATARAIGAPSLARVAAYAQVAMEPRDIFDAPAQAILRLLDRTGWRLLDVDLLEVNEAFAAQILANGCVLERAGWNWAAVNVHGGAIALGHPLGATGARLLTTLVHALADRGGQRGIACLCLGGGEAIAMAIERDE